MYFLGVDFGGGASKATLINESGKVIAVASTEYPTFYGEHGKAEQNPDDWFFAACKNIRKVTEGIDKEEIASLCFDAATHTAVLLNEDFEPLCNSVYWTDTRSVEEKKYLSENYGEEIFKKCKHKVDTIWTLPELLFVKNNDPELFGKVKKVTFAKDYVRGKFTGDFVTDYIEAQGSMLFDFDKHIWDKKLLSLLGITEDNLPEIVEPLDVVGNVRADVALMCGLSCNTKVICGSTDTVMEVFASGGVHKGDTTIKLATAGRICIVNDACCPDINIINYEHLVKGLYYPGSATKSCASSLRWFRETFGGDFREFDRLADEVPVGCDGLMFHPYLMGELTPLADPKVRGGFTGLGAEHEKKHFARAVMEGVAFSLYDCKVYLESKGIKMGDTAYVIGGGSKSAVWRQILSDVLGIDLITTENNDSSFGSAMCAAISVGVFKDFEDALNCCKHITGKTQHDPSNTERYHKLFAKYKKVSNFLLELSHEE